MEGDNKSLCNNSNNSSSNNNSKLRRVLLAVLLLAVATIRAMRPPHPPRVGRVRARRRYCRRSCRASPPSDRIPTGYHLVSGTMAPPNAIRWVACSKRPSLRKGFIITNAVVSGTRSENASVTRAARTWGRLVSARAVAWVRSTVTIAVPRRSWSAMLVNAMRGPARRRNGTLVSPTTNERSDAVVAPPTVTRLINTTAMSDIHPRKMSAPTALPPPNASVTVIGTVKGNATAANADVRKPTTITGPRPSRPKSTSTTRNVRFPLDVIRAEVALAVAAGTTRAAPLWSRTCLSLIASRPSRAPSVSPAEVAAPHRSNKATSNSQLLKYLTWNRRRPRQPATASSRRRHSRQRTRPQARRRATLHNRSPPRRRSNRSNHASSRRRRSRHRPPTAMPRRWTATRRPPSTITSSTDTSSDTSTPATNTKTPATATRRRRLIPTGIMVSIGDTTPPTA